MDWPKKSTQWIENRTLYISIPFTWNLPIVKAELSQGSLFWDKVVVGGPAISLMPHFFNDLERISIGSWHLPKVLQRVNPLATKTTMGCVRRCQFCAVPKIESPYFKSGFKELDDWPDLPILVDNNLLAASKKHFNRVIDRLKMHKLPLDSNGSTADFNQGLDARLLTKHHAERIAEIKRPLVRLAFDSWGSTDKWISAFEILRKAGLPKRSIRSYVLIGFGSGIKDAWERCEYVNSFGIKALPMWFHELDALKRNIVTEDQNNLGWTDVDRKLIMQYYYQRGKGRATILKKYEIRLKKYSS